MSASTVSLTPNQGPVTRRRAAEMNLSAAAVVSDAENRDAQPAAGDSAAAILRDARKTPARIIVRKPASARKPAKPRWLKVTTVVAKNLVLLLVLFGFVQMVRWVVFNSDQGEDDLSAIAGDFGRKFSEVERFAKTEMKAMQVQLNSFNRKFEDGFGSIRKQLDEKIEKKMDEVDLKVKALDARSDAFEKFMDGFGSKSLLSKEEFGEFFEEFKKARENSGGDHGEISLDEIRNYARDVVEKELERHAADGLGMVDYALASGGGRVVRHSEPFGGGGWLNNRNRGGADSEKMIRPSFGEPGHCFPIKGQMGFVEIRLRTAIVVEVVTLEHVSKSVAYDRSSAPKQCRVSGWMQGQDSNRLEIDEASGGEGVGGEDGTDVGAGGGEACGDGSGGFFLADEVGEEVIEAGGGLIGGGAGAAEGDVDGHSGPEGAEVVRVLSNDLLTRGEGLVGVVGDFEVGFAGVLEGVGSVVLVVGAAVAGAVDGDDEEGVVGEGVDGGYVVGGGD